MAITRNELKVLFGTNNTVSIATVSTDTSDLITLGATTVSASITVKADNAGTPAAGDTVDVYVVLSSGDPDGAAIADEFASEDTTHARFLGQLNTNVTDPALATFPYPVTPQAGKLYTSNNGASSVTFSAVVEEMVS